MSPQINEQPRPDSIRLRMEQLRSNLGQNVEETMENARTMLDWRYYVKAHPWWCVAAAAAAAAGYLLVPKRAKVLQPDPDDLAELLKKHRLVVEPQSAPKGSVVATLASVAAAAVVRGAMSYLTQYAERWMGLRAGNDK